MAESSPADVQNQTVPDQTTQTEGVTTAAESPPQQEAVKEESMLDVVQAALKTPKEDAAASDEPEPAKAGDPGSEKPEEALGELTDAELAKYGPRAQRRIRGLVKEVNDLRKGSQELAPKAEFHDKVVGFIQQKGLTTEEVDFTFAMMAAVKENPRVAYDALVPIVQELQRRVGIQLPDDLQQDVNVGLITPERARELSVTRAEAARNSERATQIEQRTQAERQQAQRTQFVQNVHGTIANWENQNRAKDPDWSLKSNRIAEKLELAFVRNQANIRSPQDAYALAEQVRQEVDKEFATFRPRPKPVAPVMAGGSSSQRSAAAPNSMLDVVKQALGA